MSATVNDIVIVAAKRTAIGAFGGKLVEISPCELLTISNKAALASANINPDLIDTVNIGCVYPNSAPDGVFLARHVLLKSGIPQDRPALHINRLCGSGFQAIINGIHDITSGVAQISLTGGTENMSQVPFAVRNMRFGTKLGLSNCQLEDSLWEGFTDTYCKLSMALTAEELGAQYNITREEVDEFSLRSQQRWKAGQKAERFKEEIVGVPLKGKRKSEIFEVDEHPRPNISLEELQKLKPVFKENGLVTAGTACGISDGAGTVIIASKAAADKHNLKPLARIVAYSIVGVDPSIMGIGPVPAIQNVLKVAGLNLEDIDLFEINEAFAPQTLACAKELNLDRDKLNVDGGAIALGHPLAASGSRITAHLVYELRRREARYGIGAACIGGGQGIALLIEAL